MLWYCICTAGLRILQILASVCLPVLPFMMQSLFSAITLAMAATVLFFTGQGIVTAKTAQTISPLPDTYSTVKSADTPPPTTTLFKESFPTLSASPTVSPTPKPSLASVIAASLTDTKGTYAIVVRNLSTGESYAYNADRPFATASLYKLWIMATAFSQIENGSLSLDEQLSSSIPDLNALFDISPEYAELTDGFISLSVQQALTQMITISHNYAAMLLTKRITLSQVDTFLSSHGLMESSTGEPPTSTARDIALFYDLLYENKLAGKITTEDMITLLKKQQLNEKLPKYLPDTVEIAHKTGELDYFSHDAGIVFGHKPYIIVVMSDSDNPPAANERIASISNAVYSYFEQ